MGRTMTPEDCLMHAEECDRLSALAKLYAIKHALMESAVMSLPSPAFGVPAPAALQCWPRERLSRSRKPRAFASVHGGWHGAYGTMMTVMRA